jgi:hypothetical protein
MHGERQRRRQILPCPACGRPVFIFPRSPFSNRTGVLRPSDDSGDRFRGRFSRWLAVWRRPLLAALITLVLLGLFFWGSLPYLGRRPAPPEYSDEARTHMDAARRAMREGSFHRAKEEITAAVQVRDRRPEVLKAEEIQQLDQLRREVLMLDALLSQSLQNLLRQAVSVQREDEWQRRFDRDYRGRSVIFDDEVDAAVDGRAVLRFYEVRVGQETARILIGDLKVLQSLPLQPPQRMLFGGRLASFARDDDGVWVIRFEPDSGVLLTDEDAVAAWRPLLLDAEMREVLRRQSRWLRELP